MATPAHTLSAHTEAINNTDSQIPHDDSIIKYTQSLWQAIKRLATHICGIAELEFELATKTAVNLLFLLIAGFIFFTSFWLLALATITWILYSKGFGTATILLSLFLINGFFLAIVFIKSLLAKRNLVFANTRAEIRSLNKLRG